MYDNVTKIFYIIVTNKAQIVRALHSRSATSAVIRNIWNLYAVTKTHILKSLHYHSLYTFKGVTHTPFFIFKTVIHTYINIYKHSLTHAHTPKYLKLG